MSSPPPVILALGDSQGNRERVVVPGPGGTIRFAVGEADRHAAVWKIWARPNKCDVYVAMRSIGGYQKVSLHRSQGSSDWRFQWTAEHVQANAQITNRVIDRWQKPPEVGDTGFTKGFSIWTRHQDVVPAPANESLPADVVWVPRPPEGFAMGVHVVIARPKNLWVDMKGSVPFAGFMLADRQVVLLVASRDPVTDEVNHMVDNAIAAFAKGIELAPGGADQVRARLQAADCLRMLAWCDGPDRDKRAWDVAVDWPTNAAGQDQNPA